MDFTELYKQSASLVAFSPGAHFLLYAHQDRVVVRRTDTFQITRTWVVDATSSQTHDLLFPSSAQRSSAGAPPPQISITDGWITHLAWSCDSEYILAGCAKRGFVQLLKLRDEEWSGRIESGAEGLVKAEWAPDGRTVVCFSDWGLRVSLWSILTGTVTYIQFPIHPDKGYAFRPDGQYFVLAERHKSKDTLGVYDASAGYRLVRHFTVPTTSLASLTLSPTGNHVAVWEGPLEFKLHVLSLTGERLASFTPNPDPGFGVRCVAWHPSGMFLAIGSWEEKIYILDSLSWSAVATLQLVSRITSSTTIWREPGNWIAETEGRGFLSYDRVHGPHVLKVTRPDMTRPHPKCGVVQLAWNQTGRYLLVRFENIPTAAYIYQFPEPGETFMPKLRTVLLHNNPILHARWNPVRKGSLILCCGTQSVYMWSDEWIGELGEEEEMAECVGVPAQDKFETRDVSWAPDGKGFLLLSKDYFCAAFEVDPENEEKDTDQV